jgi:DUF917 family protein
MVSMTMFDIHACPMAMSDEKGNALVLNTVDNLSTEKFARVITVEMGGAGMIAGGGEERIVVCGERELRFGTVARAVPLRWRKVRAQG